MALNKFLRKIYTYPSLTRDDSAIQYFLDFPAVRSETVLEADQLRWHTELGIRKYQLCFVFKEFKFQDTYLTYSVAYAPTILEVTGCIVPEACYLTTSGDAAEFPPGDSMRDNPYASCWLSCPAEGAEREEWASMMLRVAEFAEDFSAGSNTTALFRGQSLPVTKEEALETQLQVMLSLRSDPNVREIHLLDVTD